MEIAFDDENDTNDDGHGPATKGDRTAILLLDFQNEFVKKGGKLHDDVVETMDITGVLQTVPKLVDFARKSGALIIYSPVVMKETEKFNSVDDLVSSDSFRQNKYSDQYGLFTENTWNCEIIHEVEPRNADIVLTDRNDFSAFAGTKLLSMLQDNNISHFFVTGFLTDVCVYQTSTDAAQLLPEMTTYVLSDGCAAKTMNDHSTALEAMSKKMVNVVTSSDAESIFAQCAESKRQGVLDGSDEWLMIDKIFSAGGVGRNKKISIDELQSLIKVPSSSQIVSTLSKRLDGRRNKRMSRVDMHKILFQRKIRLGFLEKLPIFVAMIYMPFFYSISTRIPFIFVALEITVARGRELWEVGLILGVYQTSRAIGNLLIVVLGGKDPFKRLQILFIMSALFGWCFLALYDRDGAPGLFSFQPYEGDRNGDIRSLYALFWVGLCETIVILQRALMIETANESPSGIIDEKVLASRFSLQYSMVALGSVVAFVFGGWLYTGYGYFAVCDFGILIQVAHLVGAVAYIALTKESNKAVKGKELDGNDLVRSVIYYFQSVSVIAEYSHDIANGTENAWSSDASGLSAAAIKAKGDRLLNHSLSELFQHYFTGETDDVSSMEKLLKSIDIAGTEASLASRRPLAMAIGKNKIAKLVLFLMKSKGESRLTEAEFVSFWGPRVYLSMFESSQAASVTVTWPYMKAVVLTQSIAALCIGIFLSTALLSYTSRFDIDAARVGLLLGIGEGLGMLTIFAKSFGGSKKSRATKKAGILAAIASRPLNVPSVLLLASICSMFFSIDSFVVAVLCQMVYSSVNDLSVSLMNELIGTSLPADKFKLYQGIGQWLRRLGNMVTAILGPIFFGIHPKMPFIFFGAIVFVWALFLWYLMYNHADRMQHSIAANGDGDSKGENKKASCINTSSLGEPFRPFVETTRTPWHEIERKYYALNKERLEEELNSWKKASVDIALLESRIRRIAAALEVEKDQRRALEDRIYASVSSKENEDEQDEDDSKTDVV